jgi:peptide-methionine (R)-S-oxide reductase
MRILNSFQKLGAFSILFVLCLSLSCNTANNNSKEKNMQSNNNPSAKIIKSDDEWKKELTPMQYYVLRQKGTERPFTGAYWNQNSVGKYLCAGCKTLLFTSQTKYDSGCGWPSFYEAHNNEQILMRADNSLGMRRVEVLCSTCEGHLGHVFEDGPLPTGVRYCINSESMIFIPNEDEK